MLQLHILQATRNNNYNNNSISHSLPSRHEEIHTELQCATSTSPLSDTARRHITPHFLHTNKSPNYIIHFFSTGQATSHFFRPRKTLGMTLHHLLHLPQGSTFPPYTVRHQPSSYILHHRAHNSILQKKKQGLKPLHIHLHLPNYIPHGTVLHLIMFSKTKTHEI